MNETRDPMLRELNEMFRRRETDVAGPTRLPETARRQVRRRQVGAVVVAALLTFAVAGAVVLVPRPDLDQPATPQATPRTSTLDGVTITYPSDWYLVALPQSTLNQGSDAFRPILQLSNFDPIGTGRHWFCPVSVSGSLPPGGSLLYLEAISDGFVDRAARWPVSTPTVDPAYEGLAFGACGGVGDAHAVWEADGVTYHASILGEPADPTLVEAFASMRFRDGTPAVPGDVDEGTITRESYVVTSGEGDAGSWNLLATDRPGPCLSLVTETGKSWENCGPVSGFQPIEVTTIETPSDGLALFGTVQPSSPWLEDWGDDGSTASAELFDLPSAFEGRRGFAVWKAPGASGALVTDGDNEQFLARYRPADPAHHPSSSVVIRGVNDAYGWYVVLLHRPAGRIHVLGYAALNGNRVVWGLEDILHLPGEAAVSAVVLDMGGAGPPGAGASGLTIALVPHETRYVERVFDGTSVRADREVSPHMFTSLGSFGLPYDLFASTTEGSVASVDSVAVIALGGDAQELARVEVPVTR